MADLAVPVLGLMALLGAGLLLPDLAQARRDLDYPGQWWGAVAGPLLAVLLAAECGATLSSDVLVRLGGAAALAAVAGVLVAAGVGRRIRWRAAGLGTVAALTVPVLLMLAAASSKAFGGGGDPITALSTQLGGQIPGESQTFLLLTASWLTGSWIGWLALRERAGALACAAPMVLITADLVNVNRDLLGAAFWPVVVAVACGIALVGWTHQDRQLARWRRLAPTRPLPRSGLGLVAAATVGLCVVALALPPLNRANFSSRFFHGGQVVATGAKGQGIAAVSGYSTSVVPGGPIREVPTPVLSYSTSAPGGDVYLSGVTLSEFSEGNWYAGATPAARLGAGAQIPYSERPTDGTPATASARREVSLRVTYIGSGAQEVPDLLYPGSPVQTPYLRGDYAVQGTASAGQLVAVSSIGVRGGTQSILPSSQELSTYGTISVASAAQLEAAGTDYPAWTLPYASLPALGNFLEENQLAADGLAMAGGATDPYDIAVNVQNALRADEIYTLDPPRTPAGEWPIVYFLDQSHRGYCQYFASAMGAILRALGIPARLVNGFGPGEEGALKNGQRLITEADAHTWVQAYFPGYGWVNFEPTPDGFYLPTGGAGPVTPSTVAPPRVAIPHAGLRGVPSSSPPQAQRAAHPRLAIPALAVGGGAVALVLLLLLGSVAWIWRPRTAAQLRRRLELPVRLSARASPRGRTLLELAAMCAGLRPRAGLEGPLRELATAADRMAFGRGGAEAEAEARRRWREVRRRYPALLLAAMRTGRRGPRGPAVVTMARMGGAG